MKRPRPPLAKLRPRPRPRPPPEVEAKADIKPCPAVSAAGGLAGVDHAAVVGMARLKVLKHVKELKDLKFSTRLQKLVLIHIWSL